MLYLRWSYDFYVDASSSTPLGLLLPVTPLLLMPAPLLRWSYSCRLLHFSVTSPLLVTYFICRSVLFSSLDVLFLSVSLMFCLGQRVHKSLREAALHSRRTLWLVEAKHTRHNSIAKINAVWEIIWCLLPGSHWLRATELYNNKVRGSFKKFPDCVSSLKSMQVTF